MIKYTLCVTSCDRHDLLLETLRSFAVTCDQPPMETIIVEDSPAPEPQWLRSLGGLGQVKWISNGRRAGQLFSCDRLWQEAKTDWVFWCEDDWKFTEHRYFGRSYEIMRDNPDIITCNVRSDWHHPLVADPHGRNFKIAEVGWAGGWGGFSFNPGLRRRADYDRIGSYGNCGSYETAGFQNELALSKLYLSLDYRIASLPVGHCHHIGGGRSRASESIAGGNDLGIPRLLIAIPACHVKTYGAHESGANGWPYRDGIHVSGAADEGIQAVRDTWARDLAPYGSRIELKFFYGLPVPTSLDPAAFGSESKRPDAVHLDIIDDYAHLPQKTQAVCRYAVDHDFDYVFKCDSDTLVYVDKLVRELLGRPFEYAGYVNSSNSCSGGPGYFLSKRTARIVGNSGNPETWAEDLWTGTVLGKRDIYPMHLTGHRPGFEKHWIWPDGVFDASKLKDTDVALHAVQPDVMRAWYQHKKLVPAQQEKL